MSNIILHELCLLLEILAYCILGVFPALVAFWVQASPLVAGPCLFLSYHLMHCFTPLELFWGYTTAGAVWWVRRGYSRQAAVIRRFWPGPPPSFMSWCLVVALTVFARVDVLQPPALGGDEFSHRGRIWRLPTRPGRRPTVWPTLPALQLEQRAPPRLGFRLQRLLGSYAAAYPEDLRIQKSSLEKELNALCWHVERRRPGAGRRREEWGAEIAHVHSTDGSVHVVLHPEDVGTVIEAGWGERHPLCASDKRRFRFLFHGLLERPLPVPEGLTLVYAPRNEHEMQVLDTILKAGIWYATQGGLDPDTTGADADHLSAVSSSNVPRKASSKCRCCTCPQSHAWSRIPLTPPSYELDVNAHTYGGKSRASESVMNAAIWPEHEIWASPDAPDAEMAAWQTGCELRQESRPQHSAPQSGDGLVATRETEGTISLAAEDIELEQANSRFFPSPDQARHRGGPSCSPRLEIQVSNGAAVEMSKPVGAAVGLHPDRGQGHIGAGGGGQVGFSSMRLLGREKQDGEERSPSIATTASSRGSFTEDDFF